MKEYIPDLLYTIETNEKIKADELSKHFWTNTDKKKIEKKTNVGTNSEAEGHGEAVWIS